MKNLLYRVNSKSNSYKMYYVQATCYDHALDLVKEAIEAKREKSSSVIDSAGDLIVSKPDEDLYNVECLGELIQSTHG